MRLEIMEVATAMSGRAVAEALDRVLSGSTSPRSITVHHGTEFTSRALEDWTYRRGVALDFIHPGKPVQNAHIESFNGRLRDECLSSSRSMTPARRSQRGAATTTSTDPTARSGT